MQAWILKRLISIFGRAARRGHVPREQAMRKIYEAAGIPLPESASHAHKAEHTSNLGFSSKIEQPHPRSQWGVIFGR